MNEKDYPIFYKTVGAFDIFKGQYFSGCYVRALSKKGDHDRVKLLAHKFIDLNHEYFVENDDYSEYHTIRRRTISDKRSKSSLYEVALATSITPVKVASWLEANALDLTKVEMPKTDFDVEKISVGPCRYKGKSTQYVKIRFEGYSVPLHFSDEGVWQPAETESAIKKELAKDLNTAQEIVEMLKSKSIADELITKALTRPLNKSKIVESGSFSPIFYVPIQINDIAMSDADTYQTTKQSFIGYKAVVEKSEMADPNIKPVAVFNFTCQPTKDKYGQNRTGSLLVIVDDDDKIYTVPQYYSSVGSGPGRYLRGQRSSRWIGRESFIRKSEMKLLSNDDAFVRERAGRALSRKL